MRCDEAPMKHDQRFFICGPSVAKISLRSIRGTMKIAFCLLVISCVAAGVFAQSAPPATQPAEAPAADLLNRMLKPPGEAPAPLQPVVFPPPVNNVTGGAAVAPNATTMPLVREGTFVTDRTGRLTKSADGSHEEFTFDADGQAMQDPPMIILPNLKLELMEQAVNSSNRDLKFRVTGMVTEYQDRNYLLMERVVVIPDIVQQF
jgi:hypothetical protein